MEFKPLAAWYSLEYMFKCLLGIFVVIAVIYLLIVVLNAAPAIKGFLASLFRRKKRAQ